MNNRNKEIEEMANDIWTSCPTPDMNIGEATYTAEKLYNAGYRKQIKATGMIPFITDYAKVYSQVEEKVSTIYKLSELTLDEIIEKLAKGYEFVPPKQTNSLEDLQGGDE